MQSAVYQKRELNFDMTGQRLSTSLTLTDQVISTGLMRRLQKYALGRISDMGIFVFTNWDCVVETNDADMRPPDRMYSVTWTASEGVEIGIQGILTKGGWPFLDHGPFIHSN